MTSTARLCTAPRTGMLGGGASGSFFASFSSHGSSLASPNRYRSRLCTLLDADLGAAPGSDRATDAQVVNAAVILGILVFDIIIMIRFHPFGSWSELFKHWFRSLLNIVSPFLYFLISLDFAPNPS